MARDGMGFLRAEEDGLRRVTFPGKVGRSAQTSASHCRRAVISRGALRRFCWGQRMVLRMLITGIQNQTVYPRSLRFILRDAM